MAASALGGQALATLGASPGEDLAATHGGHAGTEAVAALRNKGVTCRICGLSANDKEQEFFDAGADAFMFKPFPCDEISMTNALRRVLYPDQQSDFDKTLSVDKEIEFFGSRRK